jgi:hypothetical protein
VTDNCDMDMVVALSTPESVVTGVTARPRPRPRPWGIVNLALSSSADASDILATATRLLEYYAVGRCVGRFVSIHIRQQTRRHRRAVQIVLSFCVGVDIHIPDQAIIMLASCVVDLSRNTKAYLYRAMSVVLFIDYKHTPHGESRRGSACAPRVHAQIRINICPGRV